MNHLFDSISEDLINLTERDVVSSLSDINHLIDLPPGTLAQAKLQDKVEELAEASRKCEDGIHISDRTYYNAIRFLDFSKSYLGLLKEQDIETTNYGTIIFSFYNTEFGEGLEVEVGKSTIGFLILLNETSFIPYRTDYIGTQLPDEVKESLEKLKKGKLKAHVESLIARYSA